MQFQTIKVHVELVILGFVLKFCVGIHKILLDFFGLENVQETPVFLYLVKMKINY